MQTPAKPESCSHLCTPAHCQSLEAQTAHAADMHGMAPLISCAHAVAGEPVTADDLGKGGALMVLLVPKP